MGDVIQFPDFEECAECGGDGRVVVGDDGDDCWFCEGAGVVRACLLDRDRHPSNPNPRKSEPRS